MTPKPADHHEIPQSHRRNAPTVLVNSPPAKSRIGPPLSGLGASNGLGTLTPAYRKTENTSHKDREADLLFIPFCRKACASANS